MAGDPPVSTYTPQDEGGSSMSLRTWVLQQLQKTQEPDPHVIARRLLARFPKKYEAEAHLKALTELVMECRRLEPPGTPVAASASAAMGTPRRTVTLNKVRCIAGVWKLESECSWQDFIVKAEEYEKESDAALAAAADCRRIADTIRAAGVTTLSELEALQQKAA